MNRLTRRTRRPDDMAHRMLAAQLIAMRIVEGISYGTLMEKIGYMKPPKPGKRRSDKRALAQYEADAEEAGRKLEADLANATFSLFQRYARAVGARLDAGIAQRRPRLTPVEISRTIRNYHKTVSRKYGRRPRRRLAL